ncbi:glycerol-3-phosphate dehydrogenase/oxidase [Phaeovulum sp. W22_SRMD_FR3]|uniref:glycerol-3-phosphate dehydrogenase/oxidase n=1 Tax=Phaeovulum sp. W22_SRMD_FR3 TaxID=3240274 RepID=UPI003F9B8789
MPDMPEHFSPPFRDSAFARLAGLTAPEVLILGGGVNGVAALRDLALNGVSAVLLERGDFCAGASSASTRMAHGGLRYLEGREFGLVAESARERNLLLRHAPHLVRPLEIVVPLNAILRGILGAALRFSGLSQTSGTMSLLALKVGLVAYERFGAVGRVLPGHSVTLQRAHFPAALRRGTRAVVRYFDGQIDNPEGLIFEMLTEAVAAHPAVVAVNHTNWSLRPDGAVEVAAPDGPLLLRPKVIVNATGAWIDVVNARLGLQTRHVRGVKGAHLVLDHPELHARMAGRAFYFEDARGRMVICLPLAETILMGTTEIETPSPDDSAVTETEICYLLAALSGLFDDISVSRAHLVSVTTGIRPLQNRGGSANRAARDHALAEDHLPDGRTVLSLVGGKWTTFRSFAELSTDRVLGLLGRTRQISTRARDYPGAGARGTDLLTRRYGRFAAEIAEFCAGFADRPLIGAPTYTAGEIRWLIRHRAARHLEDLVLRRTQLALAARLHRSTLEDMAGLLADELGKDAAWQAAELARALADPRIYALRQPPEESIHA